MTSNSKARGLVLDGLDRLREKLDEMAVSCAGWQFMLEGAPPPFEIGDVQVRAYCQELEKQAGMVMLEAHIVDGTALAMLDKMAGELQKVGYDIH